MAICFYQSQRQNLSSRLEIDFLDIERFPADNTPFI